MWESYFIFLLRPNLSSDMHLWLDKPRREDLHKGEHPQTHVLGGRWVSGHDAEGAHGLVLGRLRQRLRGGRQDGQTARGLHGDRPMLGHLFVGRGVGRRDETRHFRRRLAGLVSERTGINRYHDNRRHPSVRFPVSSPRSGRRLTRNILSHRTGVLMHDLKPIDRPWLALREAD